MSLSDIEIRVLGALVEKERTTPEHYPLSTNALVQACNQRTSREPVTDYGLAEVEETLRALRTRGLVRSVQGASARVVKHAHRLEEAFELRPADLAALAVLMLRGPQTPGELRARTERYDAYADAEALQASLERLAEHRPPLARNLGRGPGQSQDRWGHLLGEDPERQRPRVRAPDGEGPARPARHAAGQTGDVAELRLEVARLRRQLARVLEHLGLEEEGAGG